MKIALWTALALVAFAYVFRNEIVFVIYTNGWF